MREILFRGERVDNGEWIEGGVYYFDGSPERMDESWIYALNLDENNVYRLTGFPVNPNTVGQFTGLTDKNGTKIFEGDIMEWPTGDIGHVVYESSGCQFRIKSDNRTLHIGLNVGDNGEAIVNGNIHDK